MYSIDRSMKMQIHTNTSKKYNQSSRKRDQDARGNDDDEDSMTSLSSCAGPTTSRADIDLDAVHGCAERVRTAIEGGAELVWNRPSFRRQKLVTVSDDS